MIKVWALQKECKSNLSIHEQKVVTDEAFKIYFLLLLFVILFKIILQILVEI